ncbi:ImpA family metalloprotease [Thiothrix subterranea]|uniref:ImpA family metalloprotease n=1 Tax=Thiothrix subterranea TaxID=2735563 RepID=UPI003899C87F
MRTGNASVATSEELLDATIAALASQKATPSLLTALYGSDSIAYTPGNRTQLINFKPWVDSVFPIVVGNKGNTLAVAGTTPTARYAAFGISPMELFQANKSLTFETPFSRLLAWLLAGEPVNTDALSGNRKIALSFVSSEHTEIKAWIAKKYPSWTVIDCNTVATLATCYGSADLVVTGWQGNNADAQTIRQALATVMTAGKPVLYLHTWYEDYNDVAHAIADLLKFSLPYGGNYWANDAANWANVTAMQTATWEKQGLAGVETLLKHFKANDYSIATRNTAFYPGANKVRAIMTLLDESKVNLFQSNESRLYRLLALLGDSYRQEIVFPMDMDATNATVFLKSLFADHAVYNYRTLNRVQADMGNFSRSNFSHITPVTKTVTMTSRQNFRAAGVYALPGRTVRVTRNDNSSTNTKVFVNSLRSGSTHEYETWGYKRPKFLESAHVPIN